MTKNNLSMVDKGVTIPFTNGYSLFADAKNPEWFLKFKRKAFESYLKQYDLIDGKVKNFISADEFCEVDINLFPSLDMLSKYPMLDVEAYTMVLVNGRYCPELSSEEELPFSVFSDGMGLSLSDDGDFLNEKLKCDENPLVALNSAYLSNGIVIDIEKDTKLSKPIHIVSIVCGDDDKFFLNPRVFVNVGENASVDIIESNLSMDEKYFENKVLQFNIGKNSFVNHYRYFNVSKNSLVTENDFFDLGDGAELNQISFAKNLGFLNKVYDFSIGESAKLSSLVSVDTKSKNIVDIDAVIRHLKDGGKSDVSLFAVANDEAEVNFKTSVECVKNISGINTNQISRIILNSLKASGRIKPLQNIASEKVKAYHGAVVSGVNPKDLFFLESRGLDEQEAKDLVLKSCLANILQNIHNEKIYDAFYNLIWL